MQWYKMHVILLLLNALNIIPPPPIFQCTRSHNSLGMPNILLILSNLTCRQKLRNYLSMLKELRWEQYTIDKLCKVRNIRSTTWNAYKWYTSTFCFTKRQFIILAVEYHKPNKYWNSVMHEQVRLKEIKDVPNQT